MRWLLRAPPIAGARIVVTDAIPVMVATHGGTSVCPVAPIRSNVAISRLIPPVMRRPTACKGRSNGSWYNGDDSHRKCQYLCAIAQHRSSPRHEFMLASTLANAAIASCDGGHIAHRRSRHSDSRTGSHRLQFFSDAARGMTFRGAAAVSGALPRAACYDFPMA